MNNKALILTRDFVILFLVMFSSITLYNKIDGGLGGVIIAILFTPLFFAAVILFALYLLKVLNGVLNIFRTQEQIEQIKTSTTSRVINYTINGLLIIFVLWTLYYYASLFNII